MGNLKIAEDSQHKVQCGEIGNRVFFCKVNGRLTESLGLFLEEQLTLFADSEDLPFVLAYDWSQMSGYESEVRRSLTSWGAARRQKFARAEVLVSNRIVAMGLSVANLVLGVISVYHRKEDFAVALEEHGISSYS